MRSLRLLPGVLFADILRQTVSFQPQPHHGRSSTAILGRNPPLLLASQREDVEEEYRNPAARFLSNFMEDDNDTKDSSTANIDWEAPKMPLDMETLVQALDAELYEKEWFVTGQVNPVYFSSDFRFQDPDVKVSGIREYAQGVQKIFDSSCRAEIMATTITGENQITCRWRLSGTVRILGGLAIKPYIVRTEFTVADGLIVFQQDKFDLPGWDIILSALFPPLIGKVTAPPAPPVEARDRAPLLPSALQNGVSPIGALQGLLGMLNPKETS